jgi:acetylornithine deacetylase/succinyl-diaminopimelate desuccinylase-like protein
MPTMAVILAMLLLFLGGMPAAAQPDAVHLMQQPAVKAALEDLRAREPQTIEDQIRLCEVEAPPFKEARRAELYATLFEQAGLTNVRIDKEGNVLGEKRGTGGGPHVVFSAHLDTVFPEGTDVKVRREGNVLHGPGIGDDCRGLAVVLAVARAMVKHAIQTPGTITFVGTVGEEGLGDLRGVKYLFREKPAGQIDRFVSVDGTGYGITHIAVGSLRYRLTYKGPGGHSYGAFGMVNPIHALGRAIDRIADFEVPSDPKTTFNVGRIGGGTSVNAIPFEAWAEVDMRSADPKALEALHMKFQPAVPEPPAADHARWGSRELSVDKQLVGNRPAGRTPADSPIVRAAVAATKALGLPVSLDEGSTDSNIPMSLGIPAITIDGGGRGRGAHSLNESFDATDSWQGTARALLIAVALAHP